jgi:hypothetical protein
MEIAAKFIFFEGTKLAGTRDILVAPIEWGNGFRSSYHPSIAYFCPECGEIWGRAVFSPSGPYDPIVQAKWIIETRHCPKHGDGYFLVGLSDSQLSACSKELLKREALLLMLHH